VLAPGLAFDRRGNRLGYGGGYFDGFLARCPPDAARVGIGFHVQVVDAVPHGDADQPLDLLVTELETIACPPR
jgi:5-formyltetrahydrofolate cyclo-ligase